MRVGLVTVLTTVLALWCTPLGAGSAAIPGRIAFVGVDSNIYHCDGLSSKVQCLTCRGNGVEVRAGGVLDVGFVPAAAPRNSYNWPTYSPDGAKLAYVSTSVGEEGATFGIDVFDFKTGAVSRIFESGSQQPIYLFWLSDSKRLSFLLSGRHGLSLMLAEAREGAPVRLVVSGVPLFFDWNLPRHELAVHTNTAGTARTERVYLISLTANGQQVEKVLALGYAPFKAPAWSRDRRHLAYVASGSDGQVKLFLTDAEARHPKPLVTLTEGESSFVWAPDSRHIAYATASASEGEPPVFDGIGVVDTVTGKIQKAVKGPVAAYYFSPDSRHLAYVGAPEHLPFYSWNVADLGTARSRHLLDFITTREEALAYRYFDQLALSHRIWSPSSDALVFAGLLVTKESALSPHGTPPPSVWIVPVGKQGKPQKIADGTLAFWSPVSGN